MKEKKSHTKTQMFVRVAGVMALALLMNIQMVLAAPLSLEDVAPAYLEVSAYDTISGIESLVEVTNGTPGAPVTVTLTDPQGVVSQFNKTITTHGVAEVILSKSVVIRSGIYRVTATSNRVSAATTFQVFGSEAPNLETGRGGDPAQLVAVNATPHDFQIENLPASVSIGDPTSFSLKAVDANGAVVTTYVGKVHFSSTDSNAQVPVDYTFLASDQGKKTFDLGLTLRTVGTQKLYAQDTVTDTLRGEKTVEVMRGAAGAVDGEVYITNPAPGTYSKTTLDVEGGAPPNVKVQIYDNNQQIGETMSNTGGRFTFTTSLLRDGEHQFRVDTANSQSTPVTVTIDSTPAQVQNVTFEPTAVEPGGVVKITVVSDTNLSGIRATVGDYITALKPDAQNPGTYIGQLVAPNAPGEHTVTVIVSDNLGNSAPPAEVGTITVNNALSNQGSFSFNVPSTVANVQARGVLNGVMLTWTEAQAEAGIMSYKIYYGTVPNDLKTIVDTKSKLPNFLVNNLVVGTPYYFRVSAVDVRGNESDNLSNMVTGTPTDTAVALNGGSNGAANSLALCEPGPCPVADLAPYTPYNGPALLIPFIGSGAAGLLSMFRRKKK